MASSPHIQKRFTSEAEFYLNRLLWQAKKALLQRHAGSINTRSYLVSIFMLFKAYKAKAFGFSSGVCHHFNTQSLTCYQGTGLVKHNVRLFQFYKLHRITPAFFSHSSAGHSLPPVQCLTELLPTPHLFQFISLKVTPADVFRWQQQLN